MKHTYLYKEGSGLIVRISDTERPEVNNYRIATTEIEVPEYDENWFNSDLKDWLSSCQSYPVAKGEEEKFIKCVENIYSKPPHNFEDYMIIEALPNGLKIPEVNLEIKQVPETDERNTVYHATYAYFKESKAEEDQEVLWKKLFDIFYDARLNYYESEKLIKQNFNLIPKEK